MSEEEREEEKKKGINDLAQADQNIAFIGEFLPRLYWTMYTNLQEQGFTKEEAMQVLQTYIEATRK